MFETLKNATKPAPAPVAMSEDDAYVAETLASLRSWTALPPDVAEAQMLDSDLDQLEHLRDTVAQHGTSKALIVAFNRDQALEHLLDTDQASLESMSAATLTGKLDAVLAQADPNAAVATEAFAKMGEAWVTLVESLIQTLSGLSKLLLVSDHLASWRLRIRRYRDSITKKAWNTNKATSKTMVAPTSAALKDELAQAGAVGSMLKAIWTVDLPTTEEDYKKWCDAVAKSIAPYKAIYGISIEQKGWFVKRPQLVVTKPDPKYKTQDDLPGKLGYGEASLPQIATSTEALLDTISKDWGRSINDGTNRLKAMMKTISNKDDGFFKKFGQRRWAANAHGIGARLTRAICLSGVYRMTIPKSIATVGQLRKYYADAADAKNVAVKL